MKRTAADFAREALDDGPFELEIETGPKSKKTVRPLPLTDLTYDQNRENARLADVWAKAYNAVLSSSEPGASVIPTTVSGARELEPVEFRLRARFGALKAQEPTADDVRAFVPDDNAEFDAFRTHVWKKLPWAQVSRLLDAVDEHYDPTPGTDAEKAVAESRQLLEQVQSVLAGGDDARARELLASVTATVDRLADASGKSSGATG